MAESPHGDSQPGIRQVVVVAAAVVAVVIGAAVLTGLLPASVQSFVFETPVAIAALLIGTGWVLWRISRRDTSDPVPWYGRSPPGHYAHGARHGL